MNSDSADAPARDDLPWLRRRTTRVTAQAGSRTTTLIDPPRPIADRDLSAGSPTPATPPSPPDTRTAHSDAEPSPPDAQSSPPDVAQRARVNSLDLFEPAPIPAVAQPRAERRSPGSVHAGRLPQARIRTGPPTILTTQAPVITLTRLQSGVGALSFQAAHSESVGDLRLGCAYQLVSGQSSVIQHAGGLSIAPAGSERPVIVASSDPVEAITIDLAQSREVERLIIYAYSESGTTLSWDGALVVQTYGGARAEVLLRRDPAAGVLIPLSLYNIDGEFVLRAEQFFTSGTLRETTAAFGFERISWLDDRTPLH